MPFSLKHIACAVSAGALISSLAVPQGMFAQDSDHIVNPSDMQKAVADAAQTRQQNLDTLNQFFSTDKAREALKSSHMDAQQVKTAVATLNDQELAQLASRADHAQQEFAAGRMSDHDLLIILICIAALILIIVAVH
jgi:hypothetical protein